MKHQIGFEITLERNVRQATFCISNIAITIILENRNERTLLSEFRLNLLNLEKLVAKGLYRKSALVKYKTTV